jgi:hypothetical protein
VREKKNRYAAASSCWSISINAWSLIVLCEHFVLLFALISNMP